MTIAEIRGKISSRSGINLNDRMEDLLTSNVFGAFRYLPPHLGLLDFIGTAINRDKKSLKYSVKPCWVNWSFWPYLKIQGAKNCEPDVLIGLEDNQRNIHIVMIEAKYLSGKSSEEDQSEQPNDQLARELHNLRLLKPKDIAWAESKNIKERTLVYITQDAGIPISEISQSLKEYQRKRHDKPEIFWTSWRFLPQLVESIIGKAENEYQKAILQDLLDLLIKKHLTMFHGMAPISFTLKPQNFMFYQMAPLKYVWPQFQTSLSQFDFYRDRIIPYMWPEFTFPTVNQSRWEYRR